jgi:hypothetical protein
MHSEGKGTYGYESSVSHQLIENLSDSQLKTRARNQPTSIEKTRFVL